MEEQDNIRLRSEAVRKVIGTVPPLPVRMGTGFLCLIFAALLAAAALIPYPETVTVQAVMHKTGNSSGDTWTAEAAVPYSLISRIRPGMSATLELEGWPAADHGYVRGRIAAIDTALHSARNANYFKIIIDILPPTADDNTIHGQNHIPLQDSQKAEAVLLIADRSLMRMLLP